LGTGVGQIATVRIEIRDAVEKDLPEVVELWEKLAKHHERLSDRFELAWDSKRHWRAYLEKRFSEISTKLIVAEEAGNIVGFMLCMLSPNVPIFKERKIGIIADVYVLEERRRKGVARKMLDVAVRWFKKNKVRSVQLGVAHDNMEGRAVWRSIGFEPYMITKRLDLDKFGSAPRKAKVKRLVITKSRKRKRVFRS
jgi:ribosomal protein S18 acetylase RimI-like enzyme